MHTKSVMKKTVYGFKSDKQKSNLQQRSPTWWFVTTWFFLPDSRRESPSQPTKPQERPIDRALARISDVDHSVRKTVQEERKAHFFLLFALRPVFSLCPTSTHESVNLRIPADYHVVVLCPLPFPVHIGILYFGTCRLFSLLLGRFVVGICGLFCQKFLAGVVFVSRFSLKLLFLALDLKTTKTTKTTTITISTICQCQQKLERQLGYFKNRINEGATTHPRHASRPSLFAAIRLRKDERAYPRKRPSILLNQILYFIILLAYCCEYSIYINLVLIDTTILVHRKVSRNMLCVFELKRLKDCCLSPLSLSQACTQAEDRAKRGEMMHSFIRRYKG